MKANILLMLAACGLLLASSPFISSAAARRARYYPPPPPAVAPRQAQNQPPATNSGPAEVTKKFKDLAVNAQFYMATDADKLYLKTKITQTSAKTIKTGEIAGPIPEDTLVVPTGGSDTKKGKKTAKAN